MTLVVVGDALLDRDLDGRAERLAPDAPVPVVDAIEERPRPGGAALVDLDRTRTGSVIGDLRRTVGGQPSTRPAPRAGSAADHPAGSGCRPE